MMGRTFDSSFIIDLTHGSPPAVAKAREVEAEGGSRFLTTPVHYEVLTGLLHGGSRRHFALFQRWADGLPLISFGKDASVRAAEIRADLLARGEPKSHIDVMLAGIASAGGHAVVARDTDLEELGRDFGFLVETY